MSLTEFLLARIAERQDGECDYWCSAMQADEPCDCPRRRVVADCEAKRQIVEMATIDVAGTDEARYGWAACGEAILPILAAVYADHSDYRPEWKP